MGRTNANGDVLVFDFLSHEAMHHAFNEGYLRVLRAAFPGRPIRFHAIAGQVERLAPRLADVQGIEFIAVPPFALPFGLSRHNPIAGYIAARRCLETMARCAAGRTVAFAALLGVEANLYAKVGGGWPRISPAPLHMILHGQLGDNMIWRSRNPLLRWGDFIARLQHPLPPSVHLLALELGVRDAIVAVFPHLRSSVLTLEHPILESEWGAEAPEIEDGRTRIAFLGHARRTKGFAVFAELAREARRDDLEYQAIGLAAPETADVDLSGLARAPSPTPLSRPDYVHALAEVDLVCLPLHSRAYDFTASGTVSDAITALKPLIAYGNRTLEAMVAKYGPIGYLVPSRDAMAALLRDFDRAHFLKERSGWIANLKAMREARRPERLGSIYSALIAG